MLFYDQRPIKSISQFEQLRHSKKYLMDEAVMNLDVSTRAKPKQMKYNDEEGEWRRFLSSMTLQLQESSLFH
jgi:hypothetical protein